jgi:protein-S-isoprenylcysteine O-methyltransferase
MSIISWIIGACWGALILTWVVTAFSIKRDASGSTWWRLAWIVIVGVMVSVVVSRIAHGHLAAYFRSGSMISGSVPLAALAAALCFFGILLAIWARLQLGRNWSPAPALKEKHELVTSGPYKRIRHPIYTGIIMAMLGSALASPAWLVVLIVFTAVFVWRVHVEEGLMMKEFPNHYLEYKKHTWALVPWVW